MFWVGVHDSYSHQGSIIHFLSKLSYLMHRIDQIINQKSWQMLLTIQQGLKWCFCTLRYKCMRCTMNKQSWTGYHAVWGTLPGAETSRGPEAPDDSYNVRKFVKLQMTMSSNKAELWRVFLYSCLVSCVLVVWQALRISAVTNLHTTLLCFQCYQSSESPCSTVLLRTSNILNLEQFLFSQHSRNCQKQQKGLRHWGGSAWAI